MSNLILGRTVADWNDIAKLIEFKDGEPPKSVKDMMAWTPPFTPKEALGVAFDLVEARERIKTNVGSELIERFLNQRPEYKTGESI